MKNEPPTNYYEILQVNPTADQQTIERVYKLLAKRYHPDNAETGDTDKFQLLIEAYHVLSDPEKRAIYDDNHKTTAPHSSIFFNAPRSWRGEGEKRVYQAILSILYIARRRDTTKPGVGIIDLENLVGLPEKELEFHIWYLKEKGWIQRTEMGDFAITATGVDTVIESDLLSKKHRLLPNLNGSHFKNSGDAGWSEDSGLDS